MHQRRMLSQRLTHTRFIEDGNKRAVQIRKELKMRTVIALAVIVLLTLAAHAQGMGKGNPQTDGHWPTTSNPFALSNANAVSRLQYCQGSIAAVASSPPN